MKRSIYIAIVALLAILITGCKQSANVIELTCATTSLRELEKWDFVETNTVIKKRRIKGHVVTLIGEDKFTRIDDVIGCAEQIKLPSTIEIISPRAFEGCDLKSIEIPTSVTTIGDYAFADSRLQSCNIPENVTEIGTSIFMGCDSLTQITVSEGNKLFDSRYNCNAVISTSDNVLIAGCANSKIPDSVTRIGQDAFREANISRVIFPSSVLSIGSGAFQDCLNLTYIKWSDNLSVIESNAFQQCDGLTELWFPQSLTEIREDAFHLCDGITSLYITDNVKKLDGFKQCENLEQVIIDASKVECDAFGYCKNLKKIVFHSNVSYIDEWAFNKCPIEEVEIGTPRTAFSCHLNAFGHSVPVTGWSGIEYEYPSVIAEKLLDSGTQRTVTSISDCGFVIVREDGMYFRQVDLNYDGDEI